MKTKIQKRDYCGCCGKDIGPESGNLEPWCGACREHVGKTGQAYMRTYFALHGVECRYRLAKRNGKVGDADCTAKDLSFRE